MTNRSTGSPGSPDRVRMYYLYAPQLDIADAAARREGWRPRVGREWLRPDGERVKFISLTEQLAIIKPGMTVYVVGLMPRELRRMKGVTVIKIL